MRFMAFETEARRQPATSVPRAVWVDSL